MIILKRLSYILKNSLTPSGSGCLVTSLSSRSHITKFLLLGLLMLGAMPLDASTQTTATTHNKTEPITIEFGNMTSEKPRLLALAKSLVSQGETNSTQDYVAQYEELARIRKLVGETNLTELETQLIDSVPKPTDKALTNYEAQKRSEIQRANEKQKAMDEYTRQKQKEQKIADEEQEQQLKVQEAAQRKRDLINKLNHDVSRNRYRILPN